MTSATLYTALLFTKQEFLTISLEVIGKWKALSRCLTDVVQIFAIVLYMLVTVTPYYIRYYILLHRKH